MNAPTTSQGFDNAYRSMLTLWGDWRIPRQVRELAAGTDPAQALELGCGIGRISRYMARQRLQVTGVDFSPVAIARAKMRVGDDLTRPEFVVDDVRDLSRVTGLFDLSIDIGCFHCLDQDGQSRYATALARLLRPGGTHLMWVMADAPSTLSMAVRDIEATFAPLLRMVRCENSRRRLVSSRWFWFVREDG